MTASASAPDGATLAVGGYREITLWDTATGKLKQRLPCAMERTLDLVWIVTGTDNTPALLAAGGSPGRAGALWLLDTTGREPPRRLLQTRDTLHCVAAPADGSFAVTAGATNTLHCLALPGGKTRWEIEAHSDWVMDLALSADSQWVASASRDRTARLLSAEKGEVEATFMAHGAAVTSVLFAGDGQSVYSGSADGEIRNWNLQGEGNKDTTLKPGRSEITALALTGKELLATLADGRLVPLDLSKRSALAPLLTSDSRLEIARLWRGGEHEPWMLLAGGLDGRIHRLHLPPPQPPPDKVENDDNKPAAEDETAPQPEAPALPPPLQFIASPGW